MSSSEVINTTVAEVTAKLLRGGLGSDELTLLHGYANRLKRPDTSESVNLHKRLILLDFFRIHATRRCYEPNQPK